MPSQNVDAPLTTKSYTTDYYGNVLDSNDNSAYIWYKRYKPGVTRTSKSASGWRPPTGYSRGIEEWTPYPVGLSWVDYTGRPQDWRIYNHNSYNRYAGSISLVMPTTSMVNAAIIKALSKLKGQNINLSVAFGERREAAKMMSHTVTNIAKSIRKFKGRNPLEWAKVLKHQTGHGSIRNIPNSWLELQYGWKPLMQDVHGAVTALNERERDGDAYRATVKGQVKSDESRKFSLLGPAYMQYRGFLEASCGVKVRLDYELENPLLATLAQLGITNPAELVWELVPYSFVVDWFLPVGNYLSAFDAALGWRFKGGTCTLWARQKGVGIPYPDGSGGWYYLPGQLGMRYHCNHFKMDRSVYASSPLPRFPGIKNPLSTGHVANALALLASSFR